MNDQLQALDQVRATAIDLGMKFGPKLFVAILILIAGYVVGRWAARATGRALRRIHLEPPVRLLLERVVWVAVVGLFLVMALQNLGVEMLPLIAGLGVAGAGVALAMQGVLGNVVAGLTIIFARPFRVGDYISIAKEEGEVLEINLFDTVLGHADLSRVVIPNRKIVGEILHNYGTIRLFCVEVGVSYDADIDAAVRAIEEVLRANLRILKDPAPGVSVSRLADSWVVMSAKAWVNATDYGTAPGEINQAILEALRSRKITIPVPRREIRMVSGNASLAS